MFINNRKLIDFVLNEVAKIAEEQRVEVVRILDKWEKLDNEYIISRLGEIGLTSDQIDNLSNFMLSKSSDDLLKYFPQIVESEGYKEIVQITESLISLGYEDWFVFQPNIIRGFDYYDGMVFEVFDNNEENSRSLFGGGRYNGLAKIFGAQSFPAVGFAPGDETTRIFLENWNLIPDELLRSEIYYFPVLNESLRGEVESIAKKLRSENQKVVVSLDEQKLGKALDIANKTKAKKVIIFGEDEKSRGVYILKDMVSGEQEEFKL